MTDPLADWWVHRVTLRRAAGRSDYGTDTYAPDEVWQCWVNDRTQLVAGPGGEQVTSNSTVAFPSQVGFIPARSQVELGSRFGSRRATVISCAVADGGGRATPDHVLAYID